MVLHRGGCHCGAVRFEVEAPEDLVCWRCSCSICAMKRNDHVIVPGGAFTLVKGHDAQTCYQFGTKTAKHLFCSTCGICSHYVPRSNPSGVAVTVWCIDPGTVRSVETRGFDGRSGWEAAYAATGIARCTAGGDADAAAAAAATSGNDGKKGEEGGGS